MRGKNYFVKLRPGGGLWGREGGMGGGGTREKINFRRRNARKNKFCSENALGEGCGGEKGGREEEERAKK